jgi:hypothetical protein
MEERLIFVSTSILCRFVVEERSVEGKMKVGKSMVIWLVGIC